MTTELEVSAPINLGHLHQMNELPEYRVKLTAASGSPIVLEKNLQLHMAALAFGDDKFYMLSTREEFLTQTWFYTIDQAKRMGFEYAGYGTAEPLIFEMLSYGSNNELAEAEKKEREDISVIEGLKAESQPLEWFKKIIHVCFKLGSSDVHFEVRGNTATIRVRLDGVMRKLFSMPAQVAIDGLSASFTVLAEERSRTEAAFNALTPQAAMIPLTLGSEKINLRYQSHATVGGLDVTVRILRVTANESRALLNLNALGYTPDQVALLEMAAESATGGVFLAGVTGSGKTTTLNAILRRIAREDIRKIISIEDPVEYVVNGVSHFSIQRLSSAAEGKNPFNAAMLAFLRMDPDIGMLGEIRDEVSGKIAQSAIQTGHKILTTVHATSAIGIVSRLCASTIGLTRDTISSPEFLSALVYQVLVPLNCEHCKRPAHTVMSADEMEIYERLFGIDMSRVFCASDSGCEHCRVPELSYEGSVRNGVKGVKVGAEVIIPDETMLGFFMAGDDLSARKYWRQQRTAPFDAPEMRGKEAWGHVLYDLSQGRIDPYYFEKTFGSPLLFANIVNVSAHS